MTAHEIPRIQRDMREGRQSRLAKYADMIVGRRGLWRLLQFEAITACSAIPGALGLALRAKLYPLLLKRCGRGVVFGSHVVLRHPHKIEIGDDTIVDDNCLLDAKGTDNQGIRIGAGVFIGRNSILSCKNGDIVLDDHVNIGFNCEVFSSSLAHLGKNVLMAAYGYVVGGDHEHGKLDVPIGEQTDCSRGVDIGEDTWLGAGAKVLDGVRIGAHAIIGAGAVVSRDIPEYAVAVGLPARVIRDRRT